MEGRPLAHGALDLDLAAVSGDDPVADPEPEPRPLADGLGREEGLEEVGARVGGDPDPLSLTEIATRVPCSARSRTRMSLRPATSSGIAWAAFTSRLTSTCPSRVSLPKTGGTLCVSTTSRARGRSSARVSWVAKSTTPQVDRRERVRGGLVAGGGPQVAHDHAHPVGALHDVAERADHLLQGGHAAAQPEPTDRPLRVGEDEGERVVQLVGHAGRERPERGEPVGALQPILGPAQLGDVHQRPCEPDDLPGSCRGRRPCGT